MFNKKISLIILLLILCLTTSNLVIAQKNNLPVEKVLANLSDSIRGDSIHLSIKLELYNSSGQARNRKLDYFGKYFEKDGAEIAKKLTIFLEPANVEGTAILFSDKEEIGQGEEMYLSLPGIGTRKISTSQQNGNFLDTVITYNQFFEMVNADYNQDFDASISKETKDQYIVKGYPKDKSATYEYVKWYINKDIFFFSKLEYYNNEDEIILIWINEDIEQFGDNYMCRFATMTDKITGEKTTFDFETIKYDKEINDSIFTVRYLRRQ